MPVSAQHVLAVSGVTTETPCSGAGTSCACAHPQPVVTVGGYLYEAVPVEVEEAPSCQDCSAPFLGSWRIGQAVDFHNPYRCGQPKKNGEPCGWDITHEPCRVHLTPEDLQRERERQQAAAERKRVAEEERQGETADRRLNLIDIL